MWGKWLTLGGVIGATIAYGLGYNLLAICLLYFGLSWLMAIVILLLKPYCQANWSLTAVWGIASVCMGEAFLRWNEVLLVQQIVLELALIFLSAFPGILWLNLKQKEIWFNEVANEDFYPNYRFIPIALGIRLATYIELAILVRNILFEYGRAIAGWIHHSKLANQPRKTPRC